MIRHVWVSRKLVEALNELGYVHFATKDQADPSLYKEGRAFYYDDELKTYGYLPFIPNDKIDECEKNEEDIFNQLKQG